MSKEEKKTKPVVAPKTKSSEMGKPKTTKETKTKNSKFDKLIVEIEKMNVKELNDFVQTIQSHFDIVPMATAQTSSNEGKKTSENASVILTEIGQNKIAVIKALGVITGKGLMDSKKMLDNLPVTVAVDQPTTEAESLKTQLETAGAVIKLK